MQQLRKNKDVQTANKTDNLVKILNLVPNFLILFSVKMLKFLDKHGIMPKAVIKASPFHTSVFLTNVGSLGIDSIYHHIYNFGTTSLFFSMGKKKKSYIYEEEFSLFFEFIFINNYINNFQLSIRSTVIIYFKNTINKKSFTPDIKDSENFVNQGFNNGENS